MTRTPDSALQAITTQRAYTLRLRGIDLHDNTWRDALWATHEAINKGAKAFGDWLLTLRGGLSHELAEPPPPAKGKRRSEDDIVALRKSRRILLALSWLSVEDERGAPTGDVRIATGRETHSERRDKIVAALRAILAGRRISTQEIESWVADCADSISAKIRDDAVWVNRSACFDAAQIRASSKLDRADPWDLFNGFFGGVDSYFAMPLEQEDGEAASSDAKDLVQAAGSWLSSRFGVGPGADFTTLSEGYSRIAKSAAETRAGLSGAALIASILSDMGDMNPESNDINGLLSLVGAPGHKSKTRNMLKSLASRPRLDRAELDQLAEWAQDDAEKAKSHVGAKGPRPWADLIRSDVEIACGFTYLDRPNPARHKQFSVMLDHAARRVSIGHSWIKRAEAERRRFEDDARRLADVPSSAARWLDGFVAKRSGTSGASAAGGEYRIRRRAIEGWDEVVKKWKQAACKTAEDRIAAAREVQSDPDIDKFGDIQLFEALAVEDAECVWRQEGKALTQPLKDYVFGHDARHKQRRFKVPAFRHPDPLRHPVFGDFGNSRWSIEYAVHKAAKSVNAKRHPSVTEAAWLKDRHGLRLGLWDGSAVRNIPVRWSSKRLTRDLALRAPASDMPIRDVARADRLGRAASGAGAGEVPTAAGLFALDDWNGRLQSPRAQLDALADRVARHGWDAQAKAMRNRIEWIVSFTAKLECRGPYIEYARGFDEDDPAKPFVSRKGELAVKHASNEKRAGHAKLVLSRLPGLRTLSVDLGHRYAASCAVWEVLSAAALRKETAGRAIVAGGMGKKDMYLHTRHTDIKKGGERTTIYRRIGNDALSDKSVHPAPWARLDRQFLIKLQGETTPSRKCSPAELRDVQAMERDLGHVRQDANPLPTRVDELMAETVRMLRLSLRRFGDTARIAYAFKPDAARQTPGGGSEPHTPETRAAAILDAIMRWHDLAHGDRWIDTWASDAWSRHIKCELPPMPEDADRWERKRHRAEVEKRLAPIADGLARTDTLHLHTLWADRWKVQNEAWRPRLKLMRRWLLPRGLRARPGEAQAQTDARKARLRAAMNVGGLSLTRITTIRELYQVQKAYAMRPEPDDLRRNIAVRDDDRYDGFGRSVLDVIERLREQRVKQIASRIVEAALGVGRHTPASGRHRDRKRPQVQTDPPCHAVVIENLRNYRPDELQTRRENRALMSWSSGKVRKYLEEGCQLHGLHLREVMPNYTSRQCSRTGLPGMRCEDVLIADFLDSRYWSRVIKSARYRLEEKGTDSLDMMICDLHDHWSKASDAAKRAQGTLRIPRSGADLFVAAPPGRIELAAVRQATQADLNAAANIGLRALLDPDFVGKWWYVPCDSATGKPARDKCAGAACLRLDSVLLRMASREAAGQNARKEKKEPKSGEITNAWRDASPDDPSDGEWMTHGEYWARMKYRVVQRLRAANGL